VNGLSVYIFAVTDSQYQNHYGILDNVVHDTIVPNPEAVGVFVALHVSRSGGMGIIGKSVNLGCNTKSHDGRHSCQ
jgi:hypothetical protein